ncbi:MAG: hypothetical protein PHS04_05120 [Tissierellia bacterium]|nr:hypothetical protein [Tissierellia bacterium]
MLHSMRDNEIWEEEYQLMTDQSHFEKVWNEICSGTPNYFSSYLESLSKSNPSVNAEANIHQHFQKMIKEHSKASKKYNNIFAPNLMEDYEADIDGFKGTVLSKQCDVIRKTLNSQAEALKEWKIQYKLAKSQQLYDTFYNMISFAEDYNKSTEEDLANIDSIEDIGFAQMVEDACYLTGVIGPGILSTILNAIYPRIFPGKFKIGMFALYILSGKKPIDMRSDTSEFLMTKDDVKSKTGTIEQEHNYYYPYESFGLYSLGIYRLLNNIITTQYNTQYRFTFPNDFRYVLINNFYEYIINVNKEDIKTLLGNDDIFKFGHSI